MSSVEHMFHRSDRMSKRVCLNNGYTFNLDSITSNIEEMGAKLQQYDEILAKLTEIVSDRGPRDINQLAAQIVGIATGEVEAPKQDTTPPKDAVPRAFDARLYKADSLFRD